MTEPIKHPVTDAAELDKAYDPAGVEPRVLERWDRSGVFHAQPGAPDRGAPYSIVIPPPNVTAALHLGHALNNTLQDVLIRYHRMTGRNAMWMPGTDHAGIATQTVVEKRVLQEEGRRRVDFERQAFVEKIQAWKDEYEAQITDQLKRMGCSCDWPRQRFTMDDQCAAAVREAFFLLFKDGLIYRGKRLVNWDPATRTALADDEVEMREVDGNFWYMRYPLVESERVNELSSNPDSITGSPDHSVTPGFITVATTRPETMLGDTAVAVNPNDPRRAKYIGQYVRLPIVNRIIPIIGDDYVVIPDPDSTDPKARYATGFLKVTPAHDPNDYDIGQRHDLPIINVMADDATIAMNSQWLNADADIKIDANEQLKQFLGLSREDARRAIVRWFKDHDLLEETRPYRHAVGHSYRSHVPIEPYLSDQWYVAVKKQVPNLPDEGLLEGTDVPRNSLAGFALRALAEEQLSPPLSPNGNDKPGPAPADWEGQLRFTPDRYAKVYQQWHEGLRDWCISRQLWWGHRIPVWSKQSDEATERPSDEGADVADVENQGAHYVCLRRDRPDLIQGLEADGYAQDPDVLDTWFSSALWPLSTLGWPEHTPELAEWNPTNVLCTAREIITLWVSRMVMFGVYCSGRGQGAKGPRGQGEERDGETEGRRDEGVSDSSSSAPRPLGPSAPSSSSAPSLPFHDVFIHAMIQDGHGQKMSKSLGNGVDPLDIIHSHGSDAMRYTLAAMTTQTQDVRMPVDMIDPRTGDTFTPQTIKDAAGYTVAQPIQEYPKGSGLKIASSYGVASGTVTPTDDIPLARNTSEKFDLGQRFANKMWNATRFALGRLTEEPVEPTHPLGELSDTADRWVLHRLAQTIRQASEHLRDYEFSRYATGLYDFFWRDLCDWYIEAVKPTITTATAAGERQRRTLAACIDASLRLLHPVMPFITERLWESLNQTIPDRDGIDGLALPSSNLLAVAAWPRVEASLIDPVAQETFALLQEAVTAIREVRTANKVPPGRTIELSSRAPAELAATILRHRPMLESLGNYIGREIGPNVERPADAAVAIVRDAEIYLHGLLDADAERDRLTKRLAELEASVANLQKRLSNKSYVERAPANLVQESRDALDEAKREAAVVRKQVGPRK